MKLSSRVFLQVFRLTFGGEEIVEPAQGLCHTPEACKVKSGLLLVHFNHQQKSVPGNTQFAGRSTNILEPGQSMQKRSATISTSFTIQAPVLHIISVDLRMHIM